MSVMVVEGAWARGDAVERDLAHGCHAPGVCHPLRRFVEHVAGNRVGKVDADLGRLWAEFGLGPKIEFAVHLTLFIFC
jgi:hypothetical protein